VIAIVVQVPDRRGEQGGVTTADEFDRALDQAAAQRGLQVAPGPEAPGYRRLKNRAMGALLDDSWIRGQAAEMGIGVRPHEVARELAKLKKQAFRNGAEFRRFLKQAHYTRRDVSENVELQILAVRIEERVVAGQKSEAARIKAFRRFISEYEERWRSRTVCAPGFVTERCSNGPEPTDS